MNGIFSKVRKTVAMFLIMAMLMSTVAFAAPGTMTLPSKVTTVEDEAFKGDTSIENVILPDGITYIGEEAFADCTALASIMIPDSVTYIGENAFAGSDGVVIVCSSTSKAAEYAAANHLEVRYTDITEPEFVLVGEQHFTTLYNGLGHFMGMPLVTARVEDYDAAQDESINWTLEQTAGEEIVNMYIMGDENDPAVQYVKFHELGEATGTVSYRLTATIGSTGYTYDFTVEVTSDRTGLPTGFEAYEQVYNVGDTVEINKGEFYFVDGDVAIDDANVWVDFAGIEELPIWQESGEFTDGGFRVTFTKDATYTVPVWMFVGNYGLYNEIVITVGNGAAEDTYLSFGTHISTAFTDDVDEAYLLTAYVENFELAEGEEMSWNIESVDGTGIIELFAHDTWDNGLGASLWVRNASGTAGEETFNVTAYVGDVSFSNTITVDVIEKPENLPTDDDVVLKAYDYQFNVGDTFEFYFTDIGFDTALIPEGMYAMEDLWDLNGLMDQNYEWLGNGFRVTFQNEGTFTFRPVIRLAANYTIGRTVTITVGSGAYMAEHYPYKYVYLDDEFDYHGMDLSIVWMENYYGIEYASREWYCELIDSSNEVPVMDVYLFGDTEAVLGETVMGIGNGMLCDSITGETGYVTYRFGCIVNGVDYHVDHTFWVVEKPEDVLTDDNIVLESNYYELAVGETFEFTSDMVTVTGLDEGDYYDVVLTEMEEIEEIESFEIYAADDTWDSNFRVTFDKDGRYVFRVNAKLENNYYIGQYVTIIVGTGVHPDFNAYWKANATDMYKGHGELWVGDIFLNHYVAPAGCDVEWIIERTDDQENPPVNLRLDPDCPWVEGNDYQARFFADQLTDESGSASFRISAVAGDETVFTQDVTVNLINFYDVIDARMEVDSNLYTIQPGEDLYYYFDNFRLTEDSVYPSDAKVSLVIDPTGCVMDEGDFEWITGGFRVNFENDGFYNFEVRIRINNYTLVETIGIEVGEGAFISENTYKNVIASPDDNVWMGNLYLDRFYLNDWNWIDWHVDTLTEDPVAEFYIDNTWENGLGANVHVTNMTGKAGDVTCLFTAIFDDFIWQKEITFTVVGSTEGWPTDEDAVVDCDYYELEVGSVFEFTYDMFSVNNMPEGLDYRIEYHEMEEFEELGDFEWIDGDSGFRVTLDHEGRYVFRVVGKIAGNYEAARYVTIIVGSGVNPEFSTEYKQVSSTMYKGGWDLWIADIYLNNYVAPAGCDVEWHITEPEGQVNASIELYVERSYCDIDDYYAMITATQIGDVSGDYTFIVTAAAGDEVVFEQEFTVTLVDMPELNVDMWVTADEYRINSGEEFCFYYADFGLTEDSEIPEGASKVRGIEVSNEMWENPEFSWISGGFRIVFHERGRHAFTVHQRVNNYVMERTIVIIVDDGAWINVGMSSDVLIADTEHDGWFADLWLTDYSGHKGWVEWSIELLTETENPVVELALGETWDDSHSVNLQARNMTGEVGDVTYRVTATDEMGYSWSTDITAHVVDGSVGLPTDEDVLLETDRYTINPGDTFEFRYDQIGLNETNLPEGMEWHPDIHDTNVNLEAEGLEWTEDGFRVTLNREGFYTFRAVVTLANNYAIGRNVVIVVGDGMADDLRINVVEAYDTAYWYDDSADPAEHSGMIADLRLENYIRNPEVVPEWDIEVISHSGDEPVLSNIVVYHNRYADHANPWFGGMTNENGWVTVRVTCTVNGVELEPLEFTVNVYSEEEAPGFTSEDVSVPSTLYFVNPGDVLEFWNRDIVLNNADGINYYTGYGIGGHLEENNDIEWLDDGIRITARNEGVYELWATAQYSANFSVDTQIKIVVGDASLDYTMHADIPCDTLYIYDDDEWFGGEGHWVGNIWLEGGLNDGEWDIQILEHTGDEPVIELGWNHYGEDRRLEIFSRGLNGKEGSVTFRAVCYVDDQEVEYIFTLHAVHSSSVTVTDENVTFPAYEYHIEVGETIEFFESDIGLDAEEEISWVPEFHELGHMEEDGILHWIDGGFRVKSDKDNTYYFRVAAKLGANLSVSRIVKLVIGTGVNPDLAFNWYDKSNTMYKDMGDMLVAEIYVDGYNAPIDWEVYPAESQEYLPVDARVNNIWPDGDAVAINVHQIGDECGDADFILKAFNRYDGTEIKSFEFTVSVVEAPENLDIWLDVQKVYNIAEGTRFVFTPDMFDISAECVIPEDGSIYKEIYVEYNIGDSTRDFWCYDEGGFEAIFDNPGLYDFTVVAFVNNYRVEEDIFIVVGEGAHLSPFQPTNSVFADIGNGRVEWYANAYIEELMMREWKEIKWNVELVTETENPIAELYVDNTWDNGRGANIHVRNVTGETGEITYRVSADYCGYVWSEEYTIAVVARPENLPGSEAIVVENDTFNLNVGDSFTFTDEDYSFDSSMLPEGMQWTGEFWPNERLDSLPGFRRTENGFTVEKFYEEGRYEFEIAVRISADYTITRYITIIVGEPSFENADLQTNWQLDALYPEQGEVGFGGYELIGVNLLSTDEVEWKLERYTDEYSPEEPLVELWISWVSDDRHLVNITAGNAEAVYDTELYDLICIVNGEEILRRGIEATILEIPEDMPTELWVESEEYYINPGNEFFYGYSMFGIANGEVPEGTEPVKEIRFGGEITDENPHEWREEGFVFWPQHDATYFFDVAVCIGNYQIVKTIKIVVGNGGEEFGVNWNDVAFDMYKHHGDLWVTDVCVSGINRLYPGGAWINWRTNLIDHSEHHVVELYVNNTWDENNSCASICARQLGDESGWATYSISGWVGEECIAMREVTVWLNDLPEGMPTSDDLWVENTYYELNVGDELTFTYDMFGLNEGFSEDGWRKEFHNFGDMEGLNGFKWNENGFTVRFNEDGRYTFHVWMLHNNYFVGRMVSVVVGSGIDADARIEFHNEVPTLYYGEETLLDDVGYANARLENYNLIEGETVEWTVERISEGENPAVSAYIEYVQDDMRGAGIRFRYINSVGTERFRVTAASSCGAVLSWEFDVAVIETPDYLPTGFELNMPLEYQVGDGLMFNNGCIVFTDGGDFSADNNYRVYHNLESEYFCDGNHSWWDENGSFNLHFNFEETYELVVTVAIGNYEITNKYFITVGDGLKDDVHVSLHQPTDIYYAGGNDAWVAYLEVRNCRFFSEEWVEWEIEYIEGSENIPAELYINNTQGGHNEAANVHVTEGNGEGGWVHYRVTAHTELYDVFSDIWLNFEDRPEDLPTDIAVECDEYRFEVGETFSFYSNSWFADGYVSENAYITDEIWFNDSSFNGEEVIWNEDNTGFDVTFTKDGRHVFTVVKWLNNILYTHDIVVIVGTGLNEDSELVIDQRFSSCFNEEGNNDHFVAGARVHGYEIANGEELSWKLELTDVQSESGNAPVELYINEIFDNTLGADIFMTGVTGETGSVTYTITATSASGIQFSGEIVYNVIELTDEYPTEISGFETEVRLNVGETYTFDTSAVVLDKPVPEGVEAYVEYFEGMDYLEYLPGFQWFENESFSVTFMRDADFTFRVAYRIGTNYWLDKDVHIVVGEGIAEEPAVNVNSVADVLFADAPIGSDAVMFEIYMNGYTPYEGENMLWEIEHLEGEGFSELYFSEIRDNDCTAQLSASLAKNEAGSDTYRVHITTESGFRTWVDYTVSTVWPYDNMPSNIWIDNFSIPMDQEFIFDPEAYVHMDGAIDENAKYYYEVWVDDILENEAGFEYIFNGDGAFVDSFRFTPNYENRYQINVTLRIGNYFSRCSFTLNVGDGIADNIEMFADQITYVVYPGHAEHEIAICAGLNNYNMMDWEALNWYLERVDDNEGEPYDLYLESEANWCDVKYCDVTGTGSATYRLVVETDSGYTNSCEFTIAAVELPGDVPTELTINIPDHFEVGETLQFRDFESVIFADGNVYEDAGLRILVPDIENQPIWYENTSAWTDGGFDITFNCNGRYKFEVVMMMGNYAISRNVYITVGTGVSDDLHIGITLPSHNLITNQGDSWIGNFYLQNYTLLDGETVEWSIRPITEDGFEDVAHLYLDAEWDDGLGINLSSGWTGGNTGYAMYRVIARTSGGFQAATDFHIEVLNLDGMADGLDGIDYIDINVGEDFYFDAWNYVRPNGYVPGETGTYYRVFADERLQEMDFEWYDDARFRVNPSADGRYWLDVFCNMGNYTIYKTMVIRVGGGISDDLFVDWQQKVDTVYPDGESDIWLGWGVIYNYATIDGSELDWQFERVDENEGNPVELYCDHRGAACDVRLGNIYEPGSVTYRLTVYTPEGWSQSHDYTVTVVETPENLPTALDFETEVSLNVGDIYTFRLEDVNFADGEVPEGASVRTSVPGFDNLPVANENYAEWHEDGNGFDIHFDHNGRYEFTVCKQVGNHRVYANVHIYVGTGLDEDASAFCDQYVYDVYENGGNDAYIGIANVTDYEVFEGENVWTWNRVDNECTSAGELYFVVDGGYVEIYAANLEGCGTGAIRYNLTADLGGENVRTFNIQVNVVGMPEGLPTALAIPEEPMVFTVGDSADISYQDFGFADGSEPEGAFVRSWLTNIEGSDLMNNNYVEYNLRNLHIDFHTPGEYVVEVTRTINNYSVTGQFTIIVNEPETSVSAHQPYTTIYSGVSETEGEDKWVAELYLENVELGEGESIEWSFEPIGLAEGDTPAVEIYVDNAWDDNRGVNIHYSSLNGLGVSDWRVHATVGENTWSADLHFNVVELPGNLPTWIDAPHEICIQPNELYTFYRESIMPGDGEIPEGADVTYDIWLNDEIGGQPNFSWLDDGKNFCVSFGREGRYPFEVSLRIGNYRITRTIYFTVGDGISNDVCINYMEASNTLYLGRGDVWFADIHLDNHVPAFDSEIEWELQYIGHEGDCSAELYIGDSWDMNIWANIHARQISDKPGIVYYRLVARIFGQEVAARDITVFVEALPEDMPTALNMGDIPTDVYLNVGDSYYFSTEGVEFADGNVPENALTFYDAHALDQGIDSQDDFRFEYWNCGIDGFEIGATFNNPGRYHFYVAKNIGNYCVTQEIRITVGEIDMENVRLTNHVPSTTWFANSSYTWFGWWALENYLVFDGDYVEWKLERITDENSPEQPVAELLLADWWESRDGINLHINDTGSATGSETYRISIWLNNEEIAADEFTVTVIERPDDLPTDIAIDSEAFVELGGSYTLTYDQLSPADVNIPEGMEPNWVLQGVENLPNVHWHDDGFGFTAQFHDNGTYEFAVAMRLGGHYVEKIVHIIAGTGINHDTFVNWYEGNGDTFYAIEGADHGIGVADLHNYYLREGDSIHWNVEVLEGSNLCNVSIPQSGTTDSYHIDLGFTDFTGETGTLRYKLSVSTDAGFYDEHEFIYNVVETPADLPVELAYGPFNREVGVGEPCEFNVTQIGFGEGYVDENAWIYQYVELGDIRHEWDEEGRVVTMYFDEPGEYTFIAGANINNYKITEEVTITVY